MASENGVPGRDCFEVEASQAVTFNKKADAVTARWCERLIAEELNAGYC